LPLRPWRRLSLFEASNPLPQTPLEKWCCDHITEIVLVTFGGPLLFGAIVRLIQFLAPLK